MLSDLQKGTEVEIHGYRDHVCAKVFRSSRSLRTLTALEVHTLDLFKAQTKFIAIVAESGEFLLHPPFLPALARIPKARSLLITAFPMLHGDLRAAFKNRIRLRNLDWWRHNRHMTIVGSDGRAEAGIYFARRLRTPFITPVIVKNKDAETLKRMFFRSWFEAGKKTLVDPPLLKYFSDRPD